MHLSSSGRRALGIATLCAAALGGGLTHAQEDFHPARPIRIVVPYAAGGSVDTQARLLAEKLHAAYGQPVLVDNRPGATGIIGASDVARAKPDGLTLLLTNTALVQAPLTHADVRFDPLHDVTPIAQVSLPQTVFVVDSSLPFDKLSDFIRAARKPDANFSFGSAGYGQSLHLFGVKLNSAAGLKMLHVPYNGEAQVVNALLGHQVTSAFLSTNGANAYIKAGSLRPLAVLSATRLAKYPAVPTFAEEGIAGMDLVTFVGVFGPRGLPANIQAALNRDIDAALAAPDVQQRFDALDINPGNPMSAPAFGGFVQAQYRMWQDIVTREGIKTDETSANP